MTDSNHEQRIQLLESELSKLRADFREYGRIHQELGGEDQAFQRAVRALIRTHHDPDSLLHEMKFALGILDGNTVGESLSEERLQGVQGAHKALLDETEIAQKLHSDRRRPQP